MAEDAGGGGQGVHAGWSCSSSLVDLVFSLDSIITAIGMVAAHRDHDRRRGHRDAGDVRRLRSGRRPSSPTHPTTKMLALAFLVLIGVALVADGFDVHIPRGYIYFAMAFAAVRSRSST